MGKKRKRERITALDHEASHPIPLERTAKPVTFFCFRYSPTELLHPARIPSVLLVKRCNEDKSAQLQGVWETTQGEKRLCQGCIGQITALAKGKAAKPAPKQSAASLGGEACSK